MMCHALKVSRSGYYAWRHRKESHQVKLERQLRPIIRDIHESSKGVYGAPRVWQELKSQGYHCGLNKVARIMRKQGLQGIPRKHYKVTTKVNPKYPVAKNLLNQTFTVSKPNYRWASDITYIPTKEGWLYLAVVMDLYSRRVVGWSMNQFMTSQLVVDALDMALGLRSPETNMIHHSDRGAQYASHEYQAILTRHGITCSMSRSGNCYDNAVVESFFGLLKRERVNRISYSTREQAKSNIFEYIEFFYNRKRRHSYLGYVSPAEFEKQNTGLN